MTNEEYKNAYSEVLEIIKYIPRTDYEKVPNDRIVFFEQNSNKEYHINYNPDLTLDENNISKRAKAIIAILFRDYWATSSQKEIIKSKQRIARLKIEEEKREKYNTQNLFKRNIKKDKKEKESKNCKEITQYKESWIKILIKKLKGFL